METFSWSSVSSLACMFTFTIISLPSMIHKSEARATTDQGEVIALNTIWKKWGIPVSDDLRNKRDEPCSEDGNNTALYPYILCDCSDKTPKNTTICHPRDKTCKTTTICHITGMNVNHMDISGEIPEELQNLTELITLNLRGNSLTGPLHSFIGNLAKLQKLDLSSNALNGTIPKELWNLRNLTSLDLSRNSLLGPLPLSIGNLTAMEILDLSNNSLSGIIPKELGNLQNLRNLDLSLNNFSHSLPPQLGNLSKLENLYIDSSGLGGEIPSTFVNLKNIKALSLSDNNFTGKLPDFIANWTNMTLMRLQGNAFQGPIPPSFSRLTSLENLLIGELSNANSSLKFISNMKSLKTLILRNCMIMDSLPSYIGDFPKLEHLDLSFNNIFGSIPQSLFNLSSLEYLFLGNNSLSGDLPSSKGSNLKVIDLSYNSFSGSLPYWATNNNNDLQLNLVANNFKEDDLKNSPKYIGLHCIQRNFPCNRGSPKYSSFAVNSGGPTVKFPEDIEYEEDDMDLGVASFYVTNSTRWAVSSVGTYLDRTNSKNIIKSSSENCYKIDTNISFASEKLLKDVRVSPGSIRYYGLSLKNGHYTVDLQFVELDFANESPHQSLQRRIFDIYIQGVLKERDFEIRKTDTNISLGLRKSYGKIQVTENFLEIHLFWAGKGRWDMYGPTIAAVKVYLEPAQTRRNLGVIIGIPVSFGLIILLLILIIFILRRKTSLNNDEELQGITLRTHTFSYVELKTATNGFDPKNKLGEGGFGPVYKGVLSDGRVVAVKQLSLRSPQGKIQFVAEIDTISAVQHRNLVKLYGCCIQGQNRLLVYEYLDNKSLDQALFGKNALDLSWKTRFEICVGMGRGLAYLHEESRPKIVHRDVKASNILLDSELKPKLSDFGLAKLYDDNYTHISTRVAGTVGYLAPEYAMKGHLTEKADVFGFGVVLLEIISGRPNFSSKLSPEQVYLLEWAWLLYENSRQLELIDPNLKDVNKEEANKVFIVGLLCTQLSPTLRPSMSRVVSMLVGDVELTVLSSKPGYLKDLNTVSLESSSNLLPSTISTTQSIDNLPRT